MSFQKDCQGYKNSSRRVRLHSLQRDACSGFRCSGHSDAFGLFIKNVRKWHCNCEVAPKGCLQFIHLASVPSSSWTEFRECDGSCDRWDLRTLCTLMTSSIKCAEDVLELLCTFLFLFIYVIMVYLETISESRPLTNNKLEKKWTEVIN
jgi:hypothetical protein